MPAPFSVHRMVQDGSRLDKARLQGYMKQGLRIIEIAKLMRQPYRRVAKAYYRLGGQCYGPKGGYCNNRKNEQFIAQYSTKFEPFTASERGYLNQHCDPAWQDFGIIVLEE